MPITAITMENFKGIREPVRIDLAPVTLLFGPNSAGKSTIVQALHYAREVFERMNTDPGHTIAGGLSMDLGGFENLVSDHDLGLPIKIRIDLEIGEEDLPVYFDEANIVSEDDQDDILEAVGSIRNVWVEFCIEWSKLHENAIVTKYDIGLNNEFFASLVREKSRSVTVLTNLNCFHKAFLKGTPLEEARQAYRFCFGDDALEEDYDDRLVENWDKVGCLLPALNQSIDNWEAGIPFGPSNPIQVHGLGNALPIWGEPLEFDDDLFNDDFNYARRPLVSAINTLVVGPGELVRDGLRQFLYLGPLREVPARNFLPSRTKDESRWANGLAAWDYLCQSDQAFLEEVNEWLGHQDRLDSGYHFLVRHYRELEADSPLSLALLQDRILDTEMDVRSAMLNIPVKHRFTILDQARELELSPQDIGVGISQVLPVIVAALQARFGIVAVEQPELHIHPAYQVALGDLFIEQAKQHPNVRFILETHSEHLLLRLLRRIRETADGEVPEGKTFQPQDLAIHFIEQGDEGMTSLPIRVDKEGDFIDRWPRGFFDERMEELF